MTEKYTLARSIEAFTDPAGDPRVGHALTVLEEVGIGSRSAVPMPGLFDVAVKVARLLPFATLLKAREAWGWEIYIEAMGDDGWRAVCPEFGPECDGRPLIGNLYFYGEDEHAAMQSALENAPC